MIISNDVPELYKRLETTLRVLLEGQSLKVTLPQVEGFPFLVLETPCDSVAFAIVKGNPQPSFDAAYALFKQLYRHNHTVWKDRNLSFVVCRSEPDTNNDAYFSAIETDVYFCRKYVVFLCDNKTELVRELLRLPFLPFPEGPTGGILRPPSAQTLLQSLNVSAPLARQIVVPQEYSAKRIVEQLLTRNEPLPPIGTSIGPDEHYQGQPTESTRIKNVEIEAFRGYRKRQEFDVDADVVVFYGPNGLGKTSFFDALDFVCTGRIGRLCHHRISQNNFMDLARHLSSKANEGYVTMEVAQEDKVYSIRRRVDDWSTALIDNDTYDRVDTLQFLTSAKWEEKKARIENIERLFRATHLFGQSDSELLMEFTQDSTLSHDLVHRMLALDDYASGLAKIAASLDQLDKQILENEQMTNGLNESTKEVQSQINAMPDLQVTIGPGKQLQDITVSLVKDLQKHISLTIDYIEPNQMATREWRAMTESALKDAQDRLLQLQAMESGFAQFAESKSTLKQITDELPKLEEIFKQKTDEYKDQQELLKNLSGSLEQERIVLERANSRLHKLSELSSLQEVFHKTKSSLQQWQLELQRVAGEEDSTTAELQPSLHRADDLRYIIAELHENLQNKTQQIQVLTTIQDGFLSWENNRLIIINLQQGIADAQSSLQKDSSSIDELRAGIEVKEKELAILEKEYENHTANQLELTRLLDEIEAHVENSICPTCGTDHKSKAVLIGRIHAQKQARPALVEALVQRCSELRKTLKQDKASLETRIGEHTSMSSELKKMLNKFTEIGESVAVFEHTVTQVGLPMDKQLSATIAHKLIEEKTTRQFSQEALTKNESDLSNTLKLITELELKRTQLAAALERANTAVLPLEQQIAISRANAEAFGLSLEMSPDELKSESELVASRKERTEARIGELSSQIETLKQTVNEMVRMDTEMTMKIKILRQDKQHLEEILQRYEENAASIIKRNALTLEAISEQKRFAVEKVDRLDELRRRCINLERTVDSTLRSVQMAELEAKAQLGAKQKQTLVEEAERLSVVKKWLISVKDALQAHSSSAISHHIEAFGPLSTLIQKRLRAVYGFSDVRLLAKGNEIRVEVGWGSEHFKPADYFSESQKQILMLSIFLASRLTQTWSGFAPILMDDPVTHFDDLNAFGFVELIRGLVSISPGKRQFFISTCEDRLFELMLKKFNNVKGGAKFYRFEGIGRDGPIVKQQR